jgi:tRNA pseudouridine55 synthase
MYRATLRLGITTDTQDREGNIIAESNYVPADHQLIINTFNSFKGTIKQIPPMFSALKVHGTPLYKLARKGIVLTRKARTVTLHEIKVLDISLPHVTFEVWCSPGTYIRTLCADIGKKLECGAHLVELERLQNGSFRLSDSISLDQLNRFAEQNSIAEKLFSLSESFKALPSVRVENQITTILRKGGSLLASHLINTSLPSLEKGTLMKLTCQEDALIAIVQSLINNSNGFSALSDKARVCKLVCFFNPQENTLH